MSARRVLWLLVSAVALIAAAVWLSSQRHLERAVTAGDLVLPGLESGVNTVAAPRANVTTGTTPVASPRPMANVATSPTPPGSYRLTDEEEQRLRELKNPKALSSLQETKTLIPPLAGR